MEIVGNDILLSQVAAAVSQGMTVKIRLVGFSMFPFLRNERDNVVLGPFKTEELKVGDVVLALCNNTYLLHRIVSVVPNGFMLQGDANVSCEAVIAENVVARLLSVERKSGRIVNCDSFPWRFMSFVWRKLTFARRYLLAVLHRIF